MALNNSLKLAFPASWKSAHELPLEASLNLSSRPEAENGDLSKERLKDFYRSTVLINDSKLGGWSVYYYGIFNKIINDYNYKNVAEVGVGYGTHAKHILQNTKVHLYLIDPMIYYPNDEFAKDIMNHTSETPGNNFNELYDLINNELKPFCDRYTWFRKKSLEITNNDIPPNSLDAVFIDGAHDYNNVLNDLIQWYDKIRTGGQILGDDYWMPDVTRAVNDFASLKNLKYDLLSLPDNKYKIYRFLKI